MPVLAETEVVVPEHSASTTLMYLLDFPANPDAALNKRNTSSHDKEIVNLHLESPTYYDEDVFTVELLSEEYSSKMRAFHVNIARKSEDWRYRKAFCKVAYSKHLVKRLTREAGLYEGPLQSLCGNEVPDYYGLFTGRNHDNELIAVLVLEDVGESLSREMNAYNKEIRKKTIEALVRIHQVCGIKHNDFVPRNVCASLRGDGSMRLAIVDFGRAGKHECLFRGDIDFGGPELKFDDVDCYEIYHAATSLDVWQRGLIRFNGFPVPIEWADHGVDHLVQKGNDSGILDDCVCERQKIQAAKHVIRTLAEWRTQRAQWDSEPFNPGTSDEGDEIAQ